MSLGYQGRFAPLADGFEYPAKRKKRNRSIDTSLPNTPPTMSYHRGDNPSNTRPTTKVDFENKNSDQKLNCLFDVMTSLTPLHDKIDRVTQAMYHSRAIHDVSEDRLRFLEYKSIDTDVRMMKTNLLFNGLPEATNGNENCITVIEIFLRDKISINIGDTSIVSAYRLGRSKSYRTGRVNPRAILVTFSDIRYVDEIMDSVIKLKGTHFGVARDYPKEIRDARKELWDEYKAAKLRYGPRNVKLTYPAALVVNGDVVINKFPGWHEILRGSRNSNVQARIEARYNQLVKTSTPVQRVVTPINETDSSSESDDANDASMTSNAGHHNVPSSTPGTTLPPGYLLSAHPPMAATHDAPRDPHRVINAEPRVVSRADFHARGDTQIEPRGDSRDDTRVEPNATSRDAFSAKYRDPALGVPWVESSVLSLGETPDGPRDSTRDASRCAPGEPPRDYVRDPETRVPPGASNRDPPESTDA